MTRGLTWRGPADIELSAGWCLTDSTGVETTVARGVAVAIEGGYLHVDVPGVPILQTIGAPALRKLTWQRPDAES